MSVALECQAKKDTTELQEKSKGLKADVLKAEEDAKAADAARDKATMVIGNLVHDSVPVSNDEVPFVSFVPLLMSLRARVFYQHSAVLSYEGAMRQQMWRFVQAENVVEKTYGEPREEDGLRNHVDLVQMLDIVDLEAGTSVAGSCLVMVQPWLTQQL